MSDNGMPPGHEDPSLDLLRPYITRSAMALREAGVALEQSWLDPCGPRDATIRFVKDGQGHALVWDEETGWRLGGFVSGRPGERTRLRDVRYLGGELLLEPGEVARRVVSGETAPYEKFRGHDEDTETFDATMRATFS
ncbi:DUF6292 family protein [Actinomadura fibrosa]|uniref:DUF6292 family protein n=1 Tax=Actinomadura fibrosa TaxID=111802 RepID=A0ABW2XKU5_9ACTN|nr:DUF6292 family protein [Actinomadura fibrosa]